MDVDSLSALAATVRGKADRLLELVEGIIPASQERHDGRPIAIPASILDHVPGKHVDGCLTLQGRIAINGLMKLAGRTGYLKKGQYGKWLIVGSGKPLPSDMAPLIIMDASSRFLSRYESWSNYGALVKRLPPATADYTALTVHLWDHACGIDRMNNADDRDKVYRVVADLINERPDEHWLIVLKKGLLDRPDVKAVPEEISRLLAKPENTAALTWGAHHGINDYREFENVIVLGAYSYGEGTYHAMHMAFSNTDFDAVTNEDRRRQEDEEWMHNVYQAVCRIRIRELDKGSCQPGSAYLIMHGGERRRTLVEATFPGCTVEDWKPIERKLDKVDIVGAALLKLFEGRRSIVTKQQLRTAMGVKKDYITRPIKHPRFQRFMESNGIRLKGQSFYRSATRVLPLAS